MDITRMVLAVVMGLVAVVLYFFFIRLFSRFIRNGWVVRLLTFVLTVGICFSAVILIDAYVLK